MILLLIIFIYHTIFVFKATRAGIKSDIVKKATRLFAIIFALKLVMNCFLFDMIKGNSLPEAMTYALGETLGLFAVYIALVGTSFMLSKQFKSRASHSKDDADIKASRQQESSIKNIQSDAIPKDQKLAPKASVSDMHDETARRIQESIREAIGANKTVTQKEIDALSDRSRNYYDRKHAQTSMPHYKNDQDSNTRSVPPEESKFASILQLNGRVSKDDIKAMYRELVQKYHPDKVSHLGKEFTQLADIKFKEINEAYEYFKAKYKIM